MPQKHRIDHADYDNINDKRRSDAWRGQKLLPLRPCAINREREGDKEIGLDREKAEVIDEMPREVFDERVLNIEVELHAQAKPSKARDNRRAAALPIKRERHIAEHFRFANTPHFTILHHSDSGTVITYGRFLGFCKTGQWSGGGRHRVER